MIINTQLVIRTLWLMNAVLYLYWSCKWHYSCESLPRWQPCIQRYTYIYTAQKSFRSVMAPSVTGNILMISSEALSVSPRVLTSEVSFVLKGISRNVNPDNRQWIWKHLIIDIRLLKNLLCCNILVKKCVFQFHSSFVQNIVKKIHPVHVTKFDMQKDCPCKQVYPGSNYHCLNLPFIYHNMTKMVIPNCTSGGSICRHKFSKKAYR